MYAVQDSVAGWVVETHSRGSGFWVSSLTSTRQTHASTFFAVRRYLAKDSLENLYVYQARITATENCIIILCLQVYYFDGTVPCFQSTHLYISIVALILSIVVVVPFPLLILAISFRRFKVDLTHIHIYCAQLNIIPPTQFTQPFTDVLNKDIKLCCRWWSGFDLLRRLLFISVVFFFNYVQPRYTQVYA